MSEIPREPDLIRWFSDIGLGDVPLVGGKNASLGEMYNALSSQGVRVPDGFAITTEAYRRFLARTKLSLIRASTICIDNTYSTLTEANRNIGTGMSCIQ